MDAKIKKRLSLAEIRKELTDAARAGSAFIDGELCRGAFRPYADTFMNGDDLDLDPETGVPLKKMLMRLERFSRVNCSTALYRRRPDMPDRFETFLIGFCGSPATTPVPPYREKYRPPRLRDLPEMKAAFKGKTAARTIRGVPATYALIVRKRSVPARNLKGNAVVEVFAPLRDSMGEVAAVLEVFAAAVGR